MATIAEISRELGASTVSWSRASILTLYRVTRHSCDFAARCGGMHFQGAPTADSKLVRCTMGRIHDVIVDLREDSMTRGQIYVNQLAADIPTMLYVPPGFAYGFQTLSDDTIVEYQIGVENVPDLYDGFVMMTR